jgi:hypothetical protein
MYTVKDGTSLALKISGPHTKSCGIASDPFFRDLFLRHHRHKSAPIYYKQDEKSGKKYGLIYLRLNPHTPLKPKTRASYLIARPHFGNLKPHSFSNACQI